LWEQRTAGQPILRQKTKIAIGERIQLRLDPNARGSYSAIVTTLPDIFDKGSAFPSAHRKLFHTVVLLTTSLCLLEHLVESLIGWDTFLVTGKDTETVLFFVFLLLGLGFSLAALIRATAKVFRRLEALLVLLQAEIPAAPFTFAVRPDSSPPLPLRI
jgi:hypothetical protein